MLGPELLGANPGSHSTNALWGWERTEGASPPQHQKGSDYTEQAGQWSSAP